MEESAEETTGLTACNAGIMIADDEQAITALFKEILSKEFPGRTIDLASDGVECVDLFAEAHHQIILMDLHMPIKDGLCAFQELSKICRERSWELPAVLFFTGFAPPEAICNIIAADPRHQVLMKPIALDTLLDAVRERIIS